MGNFTLADAVRIAEFGHFHQRDKAGEPYIKHPLRVLETLKQQGAQPYVQMAGVLHDVTEDFKYTRITLDMLRTFGVPEATLEIVRLCDRNLSEIAWYHKPDVDDPIAKDEFYYAEIRRNPGAVQVKLADIGDNQQPWRVVYLPVEKQKELDIKYTKAIKLLTGEAHA